jgi:AcrR family transcriptional regulator
MGFDKSFEHSDKLFDAAIAEFIANGYEQASINVILKNAGMSKGQFYYHFKNKEDLYFALIDILVERKVAFLSAEMQPEDYQGDIFSVLRSQIRYGMAFAAKYPSIDQFAQRFTKEQGTPIYEKALKRHDFANNAGMHALITAAAERGDFRPNVPTPFAARMITHLFTHASELIDYDDTEALEENLNQLITFMQYGLARS